MREIFIIGVHGAQIDHLMYSDHEGGRQFAAALAAAPTLRSEPARKRPRFVTIRHADYRVSHLFS
jgi:hypothetical protein